jgi:capsular polysaccharide biosynthesis protein
MIGYLRSNFRNFNTYKVLWLEKCTKHKIMVLKPVCESVIYSPKSLNNESDINKIVVPQINLYKFYDAIVSVRDSSILISDGVVIEDVLDFGVTTGMARYGSNLLMAHSESVAIVRLNEFETLDSGFFLGGSGSQNYYHFLIEILPKLQYFPKVSKMMGKVPILVNRIVNDITSFSKLLNVAMHNIDAELVFLEPEKTYKIKCCYYISNVNGLVFNFKPKIKNLSTPPPHSFFRRDSLDYIKNIGISLLDNANREHVFHEQLPKKIFLGRKSIRRIYNQDEVYEVFKKRGYKMIFPEDHCIEDQVRLFQNADCIAGPTGAAWTNLVFCEQKAKCLCWMDEIISWLSIFTNLAKYSGVNLNYMFCSSAAKIDSLYDACYTIDIKELEITVETLGM